MAQVDARPEQIIRSYLESQEGPVEAHILHLKETFGIDDLSADNMTRMADALENASIGVEPPLKRVPEDGKLILSLRNGGTTTQPASPNGSDAELGSRLAKHSRFPRRTRRPKAPKKRPPAKLNEEAIAARDALEKALLDGKGTDRVGGAVAALESTAANPEAGLAAITDLLPKFTREAERRLKESEDALQTARAAREQVVERLAGLDSGLSHLADREGSRTRTLESSGKRAQALSKQSGEKVDGVRRELLNEIAGRSRRDTLKRCFDELAAAAHQLLEARKAEAAQTATSERELSAASAKVVSAREEVEASLSDPAARDQLEARVAALREAEGAEAKAAAAVKDARSKLESAIGKASTALNDARDRMGEALASEQHETELRKRLELLGKAQRESIEVFEHQLGAMTQKLGGDEQTPKQLRTAAVEALRIVQPEGEEADAARIEAAIAANRAALEALRPIDELLQVRARVAEQTLGRLSSSERQLTQLTERAKVDKADLEEQAEALERARQAAGAAEKRRAELESGLSQRQKELQSAREVAEKASRGSKQLKASQGEAQALRARLERAEAEAGKRITALSGELKQKAEESQRRTADLERTGAELKESRSQVEAGRARLAKAETSIRERQAELEQADKAAKAELDEARSAARAELAKAEKEAGQRHEALANELRASRSQTQEAEKQAAAHNERLEQAEAKLRDAQTARKQTEQQAREADAKRKQAEEQVRQADARRERAETNAEKALARFGEVEMEVEELRERLANRTPAEQGSAKRMDERDDASDELAELQAALAQRTAELEQVRAKTSGDKEREQLERQLAEQAAELDRLRRYERAAGIDADRLSEQLQGKRGGDQASGRRSTKEGQLMDAVDSVRRALMVQLGPDADTAQPRRSDEREQR